MYLKELGIVLGGTFVRFQDQFVVDHVDEELFAAVRTALDTLGGHVVVAMSQQALELSEDGLGKNGAGSVLSRKELEIFSWQHAG